MVTIKKPVFEIIHGELMHILKEVPVEIPGHTVFPGQILDPNEAVEYLRGRLEDHSEK